jgi:hypothetical protein
MSGHEQGRGGSADSWRGQFNGAGGCSSSRSRADHESANDQRRVGSPPRADRESPSGVERSRARIDEAVVRDVRRELAGDRRGSQPHRASRELAGGSTGSLRHRRSRSPQRSSSSTSRERQPSGEERCERSAKRGTIVKEGMPCRK